jgi:hypothetical protein
MPYMQDLVVYRFHGLERCVREGGFRPPDAAADDGGGGAAAAAAVAAQAATANTAWTSGTPEERAGAAAGEGASAAAAARMAAWMGEGSEAWLGARAGSGAGAGPSGSDAASGSTAAGAGSWDAKKAALLMELQQNADFDAAKVKFESYFTHVYTTSLTVGRTSNHCSTRH